MSTKEPVDLAARQRAATALDVSMALSAGAGSGKTSVLAARIVESLRRGTAPSRVAAVTFTEKAAGELLVRVRDSLEAQAADRTRSDDDRAVLTAALARFGELTITTIHGFCRELLRREAFAAGFAPATVIGESRELTAVYERALATWQRGLRQKRSHLAQLVEAMTTRTSRLAALQHLDGWRHHRAYADDVPALDLDTARATLLPLIAAVSAAAQGCTAPACKLLEKFQPLVD
ncbi:MAG TPA: UvrD-helicase domain-containing protein, partial [Myxococcota bacterium]